MISIEYKSKKECLYARSRSFDRDLIETSQPTVVIQRHYCWSSAVFWLGVFLSMPFLRESKRDRVIATPSMPTVDLYSHLLRVHSHARTITLSPIGRDIYRPIPEGITLYCHNSARWNIKSVKIAEWIAVIVKNKVDTELFLVSVRFPFSS